MSGRCRLASSYVQPFRFRPDLAPGSMTEQMAVPWQADFADCRHFWWPAQRPDDVIPEQEYRAVVPAQSAAGDPNARPMRTVAFRRQRWDRGIGDQISTALDWKRRDDLRHREMVQEWAQLGFVVPAPDRNEVWMETERGRYVGLRHRDYFHIMLNLDEHPDFAPVAGQLAEQFLRQARNAQADPYLDSDLRPFRYDERAFEIRLDTIYQDLVDAVDRYHPDQDVTFRSRADAIERIRQSAPLNQTDGLWLRNIAKVGPIDEIDGLLTRIWLDEVGGGDPVQNHANIYTALLANVGIDTEPLGTADYAHDPALYESAFTLPLLQLVVSQFSKKYLPEILGMTLYFEWESVELATTQRLLERYDIDATYYRLHVAIDNAAAGHGALAKRAVQRYLTMVRRLSGEEAMQRQWQRVWDGYVAFRTTGTMGNDLREALHSSSRARDRVVQMIEQKRQYGSLSHRSATPASGIANSLFDSPLQMLAALEKSGQVVAGKPAASPLLREFDFGGRMYKVFTPAERQLWVEWIMSLARPRAEDRADPTANAAKPWAAATTAGQEQTPPEYVPHLLLSSPAAAFDEHPRQTLLGHGSVQ